MKNPHACAFCSWLEKKPGRAFCPVQNLDLVEAFGPKLIFTVNTCRDFLDRAELQQNAAAEQYSIFHGKGGA